MKVLKNMLLLFTFLLSCTLHAQIAYYPFNGNADDVVNGYNGTVNSATPAPDRDGNPNSAYLFDGIDDYIEVMNSTAFNFGTNEFAVSFWIKPLDPTQNFQMIFQKGNSGGTIPQYWLRLNDLIGGSTLRALWTDGNPPPAVIDYSNTSLLFDGEWHHVIFQRTNQRNELYIDCVLVGANNDINRDISSSGSLFIGAQHPDIPNSGGAIFRHYNGLIDDVAFYDKAFDFNACTTDSLCVDINTEYATLIDDSDRFIDGVGFSNNSSITLTGPSTSADAALTNVSLELYFRLAGTSCENEIDLRITDPAGNMQPLTAFTTCNGGTGLYYVDIPVPSGSTTGSVADWVVEFDALSDQNSGDEYSVRFCRLTYTANYCEEMKHNVGLADENLSSKRQSKLADAAIKLYPVPTSSLLNLEYRTDNEQALHIEILSNDGKVLIAREVVGQKGMNNVELDVASLAAGHYYVRIYRADNIPKMQPFVKINP